jgi:hypothetical protein
VVDRIEVDDHAIRIIGDEATLEQVIVGSTKTARGVRSFDRSGAPRSMKMGTIASPWRYDVTTEEALRSANLRRRRASR